jgi:hypothetical protein
MTQHKFLTASIAIFSFSFGGASLSAEIALYPTGPSQDSAFIRFVNGTDANLSLTAGGSKAKIALDTSQPSSQFYPVPSKGNITGEFSNSQTNSGISLTVKPGEFATVIALSNGNKLKQVVIKEQPSDFNSLKSSLGLFNAASSSCNQAGLVVVDRSVSIFEKVVNGTTQRRLLNPVSLTVQLTCGGKTTGNVLKLDNLKAGERYSIFAVPATDGTRIFFATDAVAR